MELQTLKNVADAIASGRKVLVSCRDHDECQRVGQVIFDALPTDISNKTMGTLNRAERVVKTENGGRAHIITPDRDIRGMEFHDSYGPLTEQMALCVRL